MLTRYERRRKMQKIGVFWVVRGHPRSSKTSPFDRAHMTSYSTLIVTVRLSCTVFELYRVFRILTHSTCICRLRRGWSRSNFAMIFGIRKLQSWNYRVALFAWSYIVIRYFHISEMAEARAIKSLYKERTYQVLPKGWQITRKRGVVLLTWHIFLYAQLWTYKKLSTALRQVLYIMSLTTDYWLSRLQP